MKRILVSLLVIGMILMAGSVMAGTKTATFTWQQTLPTPNDLGGWEIWVSDTPTGTYTLFATIPYVSAQTTYTSTQTVTVPDGSITTKWFKALAYDTSGNKSGFSNIISATIDFQSPGAPITFTITITTGP